MPMPIEMIEIREHLSRFPPFDDLPEEALDELARNVEVSYFRAGSDILLHDQPIHELHYVRSGAVEQYRRSGALHHRLTEGDLFGQNGLMRGNKVRLAARAIEDTLIYLIPEAVFNQLTEQYENFADFFELETSARLKTALDSSSSKLNETKVRKLVKRKVVSAPMDASVREAAQLMRDQGVSSLIILDPDSRHMAGILTDRDLRSRVLAEGLGSDIPVSEIMTPNPVSIRGDDTLFEAMLTMLRHNIHHLPVVYRQRASGVIVLSDVIRYESHSSLYLVGSIAKSQTVEELKARLPERDEIFVQMVQNDATAHMVGSAMSGIGRSITLRLVELAEAQLGPPPIPYSFMVHGSMARDEQLLSSDQDHSLVLHDSFDPALHDDYFFKLATFVSDGMAACGYAYCKGGIMATNKQWRQPLKVWRQYFNDWIDKPDPRTLLNSSIFFDLDSLYGDHSLAENLRQLLAAKAPESPGFLAAMARNALNRTPPLGFFRTFVMEKDGRQKNIINLKGRGTAPLTDLIRIHALACGSEAQSSLQRLEDIADTKLMPQESIANLRYAFEYLSLVRVRHQAREVEEGITPNNYIEPEQFDAAERSRLKDAFQVLSNAQNFLRYRYPGKGAPR